MHLHDHPILIVENRRDAFVQSLQEGLEQLGYETLLALGLEAALQRVGQFDFSAAIINYESIAVPSYAARQLLGPLSDLGIAILLYRVPPYLLAPGTKVPARVDAILRALERALPNP